MTTEGAHLPVCRACVLVGITGGLLTAGSIFVSDKTQMCRFPGGLLLICFCKSANMQTLLLHLVNIWVKVS